MGQGGEQGLTGGQHYAAGFQSPAPVRTWEGAQFGKGPRRGTLPPGSLVGEKNQAGRL